VRADRSEGRGWGGRGRKEEIVHNFLARRNSLRSLETLKKRNPGRKKRIIMITNETKEGSQRLREVCGGTLGEW